MIIKLLLSVEIVGRLRGKNKTFSMVQLIFVSTKGRHKKWRMKKRQDNSIMEIMDTVVAEAVVNEKLISSLWRVRYTFSKAKLY